jgi:hypothetical protein
MPLKTRLSRLAHRPALVLALLPILFTPALSPAADVPAPPVSLTWSPNPESDIAGYKMYFGTVSGDYPTVQDVGDVTSAALPPMILGRTYYVALRAYDTGAREGPLSAELVITASPPAPIATTGFAAGPSGQGSLEWKYPKTASSQADRFTIQSSEDLVRWSDAGAITPAEASRSDSEWLYFSVPFATDKPRQFFRVAAANPFGESP